MFQVPISSFEDGHPKKKVGRWEEGSLQPTSFLESQVSPLWNISNADELIDVTLADEKDIITYYELVDKTLAD